MTLVFGIDDEKYLILPELFFEDKKTFSVCFSFPTSNEHFVKTFICKLSYFTNKKCKFNIVWNTQKVQSLFPVNDMFCNHNYVIIADAVLVIKMISERQVCNAEM